MSLFFREPSDTAALPDKSSRVKRLVYSWKNLYLAWKIAGFAIVLAILGIPFYRPAIRAQNVRNYQADLTSAKNALTEGRTMEARDLSLEVLRNYPQKNEALPIFMRALDGAADPRLTMAAREFLAQRTGDQKDRIFAWNVLVNQSPMGIAGMSWLTFHEDERKDPDFLAPWLERLVSENLIQLVNSELSKQTSQSDLRVERIRLSMLAKQATEVSFRELQARLLDRLATQPDDGPILLQVMDEIPQSALIPYFFTALGKWIEGRGDKATVEDQMRLARSEIAAHPATKDEVLTRVAGTYGAAHPLLVAQLHMTFERFETAEKLLEPALSKGDPAVFQQMAEVLKKQGKLAEWDKLLENPMEGVSLPEVGCDRAYIAMRQGDDRARTEFEQKAIATADLKAKGDALIRLARHAEQRGMDDYATDVWAKAIQRGSASPLPFFFTLGHVFEGTALNKKESQLFDMLTVYHNVEPGNMDVVTQYFYLGCLLGNVTPVTLLAGLEPIREKISSDKDLTRSQALDCTIALAHLLEGNHKQAARMTDCGDIDWFAQPPAYLVIRAIALTHTDRKEEADVYLADFDWTVLMPGESRVFRELLRLPGESDGIAASQNIEKEKGLRLAEEARQVQRAKELKEIREALKAKEAGKTDEAIQAERAEKAERARLAEIARQEKRKAELKEIREKLAIRAAKAAEEARNLKNPEPAGTQR